MHLRSSHSSYVLRLENQLIRAGWTSFAYRNSCVFGVLVCLKNRWWVPLAARQPVLHRNVSCMPLSLEVIREACTFPQRNVQEGSTLALADKQPVAPIRK